MGALYNLCLTVIKLSKGLFFIFIFTLDTIFQVMVVMELYEPCKIKRKIYIINLAVIKFYPSVMGTLISRVTFAFVKSKLLRVNVSVGIVSSITFASFLTFICINNILRLNNYVIFWKLSGYGRGYFAHLAVKL